MGKSKADGFTQNGLELKWVKKYAGYLSAGFLADT